MAARGRGLFSLYIYIVNLKKSSCQERLDQFQYNMAEMFPWWPSTKIIQAVMTCRKTWQLGWEGVLISLYIYIEIFKHLLVRNHGTNFNIILQKCSFGDSLPTLFKPFMDLSKNMATRGQGLFSLYIYIENFKTLLVRNHWTNFNIILQKCSFVDPLPRLFKLSWFILNHKTWPPGDAACLPYIFI